MGLCIKGLDVSGFMVKCYGLGFKILEDWGFGCLRFRVIGLRIMVRNLGL